VPIVRGEHQYYNLLTGSAPWDPSTYPGWWSGFDRLLAEFIPGSRLFGWPSFGLPVELVLLGLCVVAASSIGRLRRDGMVRFGAVSVAAVVATGALAVVAPPPLPSGPLSFSSADLGGPLQSGPSAATTAAVPLLGVGAGTYRITVGYTLQGSAGSATILAYCTDGSAKSSAPPRASTSPMTEPGTQRSVSSLHCPAGTLWYQMAVLPDTRLVVSQLVLAKTASG
jgi:hypothetical protein